MVRHSSLSLRLFAFIAFALVCANSLAQPLAGECDLDRLQQYESEFDALALSQTNGATDKQAAQLAIMARKYISMNANCYDELYGKNAESNASDSHIDDGGLWYDSPSGEIKSSEFNLLGTKWGAGSPFAGGQNANGPRRAGGVVTYSFMATGVSNAAESADSNLAFSSLPTYQNCFETEIVRAFAMWSAVANIQFQRVGDNGVPSNQSGATGDIRIGAHSFDGRSGTLAHAFFAPPNGNTIAGDTHFDRAEIWTCTPQGGIDIGIVATHEFGHSIGLRHEEAGAVAIMNPFYNPSVPSLRQDDINGAVSIYGPAVTVVPTDNNSTPVPAVLPLLLDDEN